MSAESKLYVEFKSRTENIIEHFKCETKHDDDLFSKSQDMVRAMLLLCHAEIEYYLESVARKILNDSWEMLTKKNIANQHLIALFVLSKSKKEGYEKPSNTYNRFKKQYLSAIDSNHGIKKENLMKLFRPLGYDPDVDFDVTLVSDLDALGTLRGSLAHTSGKVQNLLDYQSEKKRIEGIVNELKDIDRLI